MPPDVSDRLAAVFERAPGLASRVALAPDDTPPAIIAKARGVLDAMNDSERIAVLNAHPRIGAERSALSAASRMEQGGATDVGTRRELAELNDAYERKFGFRFVVFVAGRSQSDIVPVLRTRLANSREVELRTGIDEFLAISLDRLEHAR